MPVGWAWCLTIKSAGVKIIGNRTLSEKNYIAEALRYAANSTGNQKAYELAPFFKRIAFKKGRVTAIISTARKLAVIIGNMIGKVQPYRKNQAEVNNQEQRALRLKQLNKPIDAISLSKEELESLFSTHS